jgi:hypothetical protein
MSPRIEEQYASGLKVLGVPRHDMKPVTQCRGGNQTVSGGNSLPELLRRGCEFSPDMAGFQIHRQNAIRIVTLLACSQAWRARFFLHSLRAAIPFVISPADKTLTNNSSLSIDSTARRTPGSPLGRRSSDSTHVSRRTLTISPLASENVLG